MIFLAAAMTISSAFAQRFNRPTFTRPTPVYPASCSYDLQAPTMFGNGWNFLQQFTRYSCAAAFDACEYERMIQPNSFSLRCVPSQVVSRPVPTPAPRSCEYRIERRNGRYTNDIFTATGFDACEAAQNQCERVLSSLRRRGNVGKFAKCVQTSGSRPVPPPTRTVTAQCTVEQFFSSNSGSRGTGNRFYGTGIARTYNAARNQACSEAMNQCQRVISGRFYCVELN